MAAFSKKNVSKTKEQIYDVLQQERKERKKKESNRKKSINPMPLRYFEKGSPSSGHKSLLKRICRCFVANYWVQRTIGTEPLSSSMDSAIGPDRRQKASELFVVCVCAVCVIAPSRSALDPKSKCETVLF